MRNKGFTLIELIGVICIIGLLVILVFPNLLNQFNNTKKKLSDNAIKLIKEGTRIYVTNNYNSFETLDGITYCISPTTLIESGDLDSTIFSIDSSIDYKNDYAIEVKYDGIKYNYDFIPSDECYNSLVCTVNTVRENSTIVSKTVYIYNDTGVESLSIIEKYKYNSLYDLNSDLTNIEAIMNERNSHLSVPQLTYSIDNNTKIVTATLNVIKDEATAEDIELLKMNLSREDVGAYCEANAGTYK